MSGVQCWWAGRRKFRSTTGLPRGDGDSVEEAHPIADGIADHGQMQVAHPMQLLAAWRTTAGDFRQCST